MSSLKQRILGLVCKYRGHDIRLLRHVAIDAEWRLGAWSIEEAACCRRGRDFYYRLGPSKETP